ncbi:outer membrane lipoprotein carrier protein LolA [Campylobacter sp. FMV-PI01]|uniref:Outer membrane lipoprotein carrier protein LolA n=1 Tax=Campylobacter portucalensis TaxID=2608384 RepID=A0A6L5WL26_9BACT|nr:outer membrane lipoprotein carrier protein LolA [Campylobacter portucalensis]MSN96715.1 outer membrane lipoprotein carrier protein LolA [Campylobacter portucalensis]
MKKVIIFLFCSFMCLAGDEEKIKKILNFSEIHGEFNQTKILKSFKNPIVAYGKFAIYDETFEQNLTKPFQVSVRVDKNGVFELRNGKFEKINSNFNGDIFLNIFTMNFENLKTNFDYKISFKDDWEILLLPKGILSKIFSQIRINGKKYVEKIVLEEINGDKTIYEFFNIK